MNEKIIKKGIGYVRNGDYLIPNLSAPNEKYHIGKYGMLHKKHLKQNHRSLYSAMMIKGTLLQYLADVDSTAKEMVDRLIQEMSVKQGVSENFKAENQMVWIGVMQNIKHSAEESVLNEFVY